MGIGQVEQPWFGLAQHAIRPKATASHLVYSSLPGDPGPKLLRFKVLAFDSASSTWYTPPTASDYIAVGEHAARKSGPVPAQSLGTALHFPH